LALEEATAMNNPYNNMTEDQELIDKVFAVALSADDAEMKKRKDVLWTTAIVLLSDVLLRASLQEREQLLLGLPLQLRRALRDIPEIQAKGRLQ
jgi:hypothetical protein